MASKLNLWRKLPSIMAMLAGGGRQSFADSPTADELSLDAEFATALQDPLTAAYLLPLEGDLSELVQEDRETIETEMMRFYRDSPVISDALRGVLLAYAIRTYNLGGAVALEELELEGAFDLKDENILADLESYTDTLADVDGDMSLLRTTARELARKMKEEAATGVSWALMLLPLITFGRVRSAIRSVRISANERVRVSRLGLASAFVGNGINGVTHRLNRDNGRDYPPCRCPDLNGNYYRLRSIRDPFVDIPARDRIPIHVGCNCYYDPDKEGWEVPATVWTGFALSQL